MRFFPVLLLVLAACAPAEDVDPCTRLQDALVACGVRASETYDCVSGASDETADTLLCMADYIEAEPCRGAGPYSEFTGPAYEACAQ